MHSQLPSHHQQTFQTQSSRSQRHLKLGESPSPTLTPQQTAARDIFTITNSILKRKFLKAIERIKYFNFEEGRKQVANDSIRWGIRLASEDKKKKRRARVRSVDPQTEYSRSRLLGQIVDKLKAKNRQMGLCDNTTVIYDRLVDFQKETRQKLKTTNESAAYNPNNDPILYKQENSYDQLLNQMALITAESNDPIPSRDKTFSASFITPVRPSSSSSVYHDFPSFTRPIPNLHKQGPAIPDPEASRTNFYKSDYQAMQTSPKHVSHPTPLIYSFRQPTSQYHSQYQHIPINQPIIHSPSRQSYQPMQALKSIPNSQYAPMEQRKSLPQNHEPIRSEPVYTNEKPNPERSFVEFQPQTNESKMSRSKQKIKIMAPLPFHQKKYRQTYPQKVQSITLNGKANQNTKQQPTQKAPILYNIRRTSPLPLLQPVTTSTNQRYSQVPKQTYQNNGQRWRGQYGQISPPKPQLMGGQRVDLGNKNRYCSECTRYCSCEPEP